MDSNNNFRRANNTFACDEIRNLYYVIKDFSSISFIKTIYYNFRYLSFHKAKKLPIIIGKKTRIKRFGIINIPENCYLGMFSIGAHVINEWEDKMDYTSLCNNGIINVSGRVRLNWGCKVFVKKGAVINLGNRVRMGCRSRIVCYESISIGDDVRFAWEEQLFDTDFHYLFNIEKNEYYPRVKPIIIGNDVFVGNRCTIAKGTIIPNGSVISCCSKVRGDFSNEGEQLLLIGNPAKVVKRGVKMSNSWFHREEEEIALIMAE